MQTKRNKEIAIFRMEKTSPYGEENVQLLVHKEVYKKQLFYDCLFNVCCCFCLFCNLTDETLHGIESDG